MNFQDTFIKILTWNSSKSLNQFCLIVKLNFKRFLIVFFRNFGGVVERGVADPQVIGVGFQVGWGSDQECDSPGRPCRPFQNERTHAAECHPAGGRARRHAATLHQPDPSPLHLSGHCCGGRAALGPRGQRLPRFAIFLIFQVIFNSIAGHKFLLLWKIIDSEFYDKFLIKNGTNLYEKF